MALQKIGVLGSGTVGETLANGFLKHGHEVMRGSRDPGKLSGWKEKAGPKAQIGTFAETAKFGDAVVLAVKGNAAESALKAAGVDTLAGKVVMDTTNPIADKPPESGVLSFFTTMQESLMERLQKLAPKARFVKTFSCVGAALMVDPKFKAGRPTMFVCGNDAAGKRDVAGILDKFGWETADMGPACAARAIEPLCMLWCIPGFTQNRWTHAFKLLQQ
jgi:predicted dinucleotide-binding enzyme